MTAESQPNGGEPTTEMSSDTGLGNTTRTKPFVLILCCVVPGHMVPVLDVAENLVQKGYDVFWLGAEGDGAAIERTGARLIPGVGTSNITYMEAFMKLARLGVQPPPDRTLSDGLNLLKSVMKTRTQLMPSGMESLRRALEDLNRRDPSREVVILVECWFTGLLPFQLGAELPKPYKKLPKCLGLNFLPSRLTSIDTGPSFFGMSSDSTPAGRHRNAVVAALFNAACKEEMDRLQDTVLRECGAVVPLANLIQRHPSAGKIDLNVYDIYNLGHDKVLQMCTPELELPRSDWPAGHIFGGLLPRKSIPSDYPYPSWWDEIKANGAKPAAERKKVIFVAQGTILQEYNDMIVPTIRGLAHRDDLLVVAVLGARGASLHPDVQSTLPENVRVADYLLYDIVLEYADVFVVTAGYGAMRHAVINGVPLITAGTTEDKLDVALRATRAGFAISLQVKTATPEMVREAVEKVLRDGTYKEKALEMKKMAEEFGSFDVIEQEMLALLEEGAGRAPGA